MLGSLATGDFDHDSDIDFLVDFEPDYTLVDQSGLLVELRELLGRNVDVVNEAFLREEYQATVLADAIFL